MNSEQQLFFSFWPDPPARLDAREAAWALKFAPHDIPILVAAKLLKPLGNPPPNAVKTFSADEIRALAKDRVWLSKATNAIHQHWQRKNRNKSARFDSLAGGSPEAQSAL
jgi:hypothetical protein